MKIFIHLAYLVGKENCAVLCKLTERMYTVSKLVNYVSLKEMNVDGS